MSEESGDCMWPRAISIGKGLYRDIAAPDFPVWYDYRGLLGAKTMLLGTGAASGEDSSRRAVM